MEANLFIFALCAFILFSIFQLGFCADPLRLADPDDAETKANVYMPIEAFVCGFFATMPLSGVFLRTLILLLGGDGLYWAGVLPWLLAIVLVIFALAAENLLFRAFLVHLQINRFSVFALSKRGENKKLKVVYESKEE